MPGTSNVVAWWGAITGTIGTLGAIYAIWRDQARVKVICTTDIRKWPPSYSNIDGLRPGQDAPLVNIRIVNVGRRPVSIRNAWFECKGAIENVPTPVGPDTELKEGAATETWRAQEKLPMADISRLVVEDTTGRRWRGKLAGSVT